MEKRPITKPGFLRLQDELQGLLRNDRPKVIADIDEARSHGDLKENAEYHAARERQSFVEGRIQHLNYIIAHSEVIDVAKQTGKEIRFGATVTYEDVESEERTTWQIVGEDEAEVEQRRISIKSPIARALLGKKVGDELVIKIPKGEIEVEVIEVLYK